MNDYILGFIPNGKDNGSKKELGKRNKAHNGIVYWDYFIKTVQIDDKVYDLVANVRKNFDNSYVYSLQLNENKKMVASPPLRKTNSALNRVLNATNTSISENSEKVNKQNELRDTDYIKAVESGDTKTAQEMVERSATEWGAYSADGKKPTVLYHGTNKFGFTEFDLSRMDDKRSIFLTSSKEIASTYSGSEKESKITDRKQVDISKLSAKETVDLLNIHAQEPAVDYSYSYMDTADKNKLIGEVNSGIEYLKKQVEKEIKKFKNDESTLKQLENLKELLNSYDRLSTPIYQLLHNGETFRESIKIAQRINKLEQDIRLFNKLRKSGANEVIVEKALGGYSIELMSEQEAKAKLSEVINKGNYSLYTKLNNPLVIEGNGKNWNNLYEILEPQEKTAFKAEYDSKENALILSDEKGEFAKIPASTLSQAMPNMAREITKRYGKFFSASVLSKAQSQLKNSSVATVPVRVTNTFTTREIAEFAQEQGYDGVIFKDITDNGGNNIKIKSDTKSDIFVIFNPNQVKSADTVTYNDQGEVIPLSERFDENDSDIRYEVRDEIIDRYTEKQYNNFGWIVVNEVLSKNEWSQYNNKLRETLSSKVPENLYGEKVITVGEKSSDITALVYVKGTAGNPIVTRVVRVNSNIKDNYNINLILEELSELDRQGYREPNKIIRNDYGKEILFQIERSDFGTLSEFKRRRKRSVGEKTYSDSQKFTERTGSEGTNTGSSERGLNTSEQNEQRDNVKEPKYTFANRVLNEFSSNADSTEVAQLLDEIYKAMEEGNNADDKIREVSQLIYDNTYTFIVTERSVAIRRSLTRRW